MKLPIVKVVMPADLAGHQAGKLPPKLLRKIDGGGKLHHLAANAWEALVAKAKADGIELKPTSAGDTYRDYELQKRGFLQRYQLEPTGTGVTRTFEGKKWYLKKGFAPLATPGSSQHNWGLAVDCANANGKRLQWMRANILNFGWSWEVVPDEPWHIRYTAGDNVPEAVKAYLAQKSAQAPAEPA